MLLRQLQISRPTLIQRICVALHSMTTSGDNAKSAIVAAKALPLLVEMLDNPTAKLVERSVAVLRNITTQDTLRQLARAVPAQVLVRLLKHGDTGVAAETAACITVMAESPTLKPQLINCGAVPALVGLLRSSDRRIPAHAAAALRVLVESAEGSPAKGSNKFSNPSEVGRSQMVRAGAIPVLLQHLEPPAAGALAEPAIALLQQLCSVESLQQQVVHAGSVAHLLALMEAASTPAIAETAANALVALHSSAAAKAQLMHPEVLLFLIDIMAATPGMVGASAASIILALLQSNSVHPSFEQAGALPKLVSLVRHSTPAVASCAAASLCSLSTSQKMSKPLVDAGCLKVRARG